jgi:hypothetical protein
LNADEVLDLVYYKIMTASNPDKEFGYKLEIKEFFYSKKFEISAKPGKMIKIYFRIFSNGGGGVS